MGAGLVSADLGGTAIGAAIGSVVPGVGTVAVGALGAVLGGIAIDGALLKLEEVISREDFKTEILHSIREAKYAFKLQLFGAEERP